MQLCKILMADDDPDDRMILEDAIQTLYPHKIISFVENGQALWDALNRGNANGDIPSLVVLDLNMPKLNGSETLKAIKADERFKHIPVIIYSTSVNPLEKEKCLRLGAHSYMVKPSSIKESLATAHIFLGLCNVTQHTQDAGNLKAR
jgi:CheY-like chemotaxis protein